MFFIFLTNTRKKILSQETILVTGAAGSVGSTARAAIAILLEQGRRVRAMVRKLDARADTLRELGAEVVVADMLDIVAVRAAMQGCSSVYFTTSVSPDYLEAATNVAVTAKSLGVKAFVNLSQMTLSQMSETETTGSPQQKQHWLAEQMLRWSGLPVIYLRPTAFFEGLFLPTAKGIRDDSAIRLPFADGKTSPIAAVDVGAAVAAVLANPEPHIGNVYELTGPQSLTMAELAQEFSGALGRTIQYVNVPPKIWEAKLQEFQQPPHLTAHLTVMAQLHRDNRYDRMTDTFQQLVGRAPISAAEFARRHAAAFTPA
ncbi:NmrA family NAD(P)-binding protein [Paraburkholderia sp. GAS448]|uniref:NmrA family NAD(P)-binding protein n=1 Tax=Paraburkholderia sp. GAS448 TaxID=3035136 RepID=UPI003D19E709